MNFTRFVLQQRQLQARGLAGDAGPPNVISFALLRCDVKCYPRATAPHSSTVPSSSRSLSNHQRSQRLLSGLPMSILCAMTCDLDQPDPAHPYSSFLAFSPLPSIALPPSEVPATGAAVGVTGAGEWWSSTYPHRVYRSPYTRPTNQEAPRQAGTRYSSAGWVRSTNSEAE